VARRAPFVAVFIFVFLFAANDLGAQEPTEIPPEDAMAYVGKLVTVCGTVKSAAYMAASPRRPTFLNFGQPYPHHVFTIVIWGENRDKFDKPPIRTFDGQHVCVTGVVATYKGKPQIIVEEPDQIRLSQPMTRDWILSDLEAIFVKAILEAYGTDANYGTGEWDQQTIEAMIQFQEEAGVTPTGDPDAETLRALAKHTLALTDEEQERIIRLLLFRLAQRQE
jgi:hypothetical protein